MTDELKIAVTALRNILSPIKYLQDEAEKDGARLDGYMAIQLTQNASFYQEIARNALEAIDTVVSALETRDKSSRVDIYTPAEMEAFWIWAYENGWYYGTLVELWSNDEDPDRVEYTIEDVIKKWEETK